MKLSQMRTDHRKARTSQANCGDLVREIVRHLGDNRNLLREEWVRRIREAKLLTAMTEEEISSEATIIYDNYLKVLETARVHDLQDYARDLSRRIIQRRVATHEVVGIVLLLRDVLARSLFSKYHKNFALLERILDVYEPVANQIASTVAVSFVEEREQVTRRQQKAIQILHVQEEERKRISRELHDEVGQTLTAIKALFAALQRDHGGEENSGFNTKVAEIEKLLVRVMDSVHGFARELRPAMLDDLGLIPALRSYLKKYSERTGLLVRFKRGVKDLQLTPEQGTVLFRVAQESLTNVAKHARATRVDVTLRRAKNGIRLRVEDNGKGFDVDRQRLPAAKRRLGLLGMQERVCLVNGRCVVQSMSGRGTTVVVEIPLRTGKPDVHEGDRLTRPDGPDLSSFTEDSHAENQLIDR